MSELSGANKLFVTRGGWSPIAHGCRITWTCFGVGVFESGKVYVCVFAKVFCQFLVFNAQLLERQHGPVVDLSSASGSRARVFVQHPQHLRLLVELPR